jgi:hypothetical protein
MAMTDFVCNRLGPGHSLGSKVCPMCVPNTSPLYRRLLKLLRATFAHNSVEPRSAIELAARQQLDAIFPEIESIIAKERKKTGRSEAQNETLRTEIVQLLQMLGEQLVTDTGGPYPAWITNRLTELSERKG